MMPVVPTIVVERVDTRGGRFAVHIPYTVKGDWIVIDHQA